RRTDHSSRPTEPAAWSSRSPTEPLQRRSNAGPTAPAVRPEATGRLSLALPADAATLTRPGQARARFWEMTGRTAHARRRRSSPSNLFPQSLLSPTDMRPYTRSSMRPALYRGDGLRPGWMVVRRTVRVSAAMWTVVVDFATLAPQQLEPGKLGGACRRGQSCENGVLAL